MLAQNCDSSGMSGQLNVIDHAFVDELVMSNWPSGAGMEILTRGKIARKQGENSGYLLDRALNGGRKWPYLVVPVSLLA